MSMSLARRGLVGLGLVLVLVLTLVPTVALARRRPPPTTTTTTTSTTSTTLATVPTPTDLRVVGIEDLRIDLAWDPAPGATGYQIEQNGLCCYWQTPPSFTAGPFQAGTSNTFRVRTVTPDGRTSPFTAPLTVELPPDDTPPTVPVNLRATDIDVTTVSLAWDGGDDENGNVHFRVLLGGEVLQNFVWGKSFRAIHLTRDTEHQFQAIAADYAGNESPASDILSVRTDESADFTPPTTPVILSASGNWDCEINVRYSRSTDNIDPPDAISYEFWTDGVLNAIFVGGTGDVRVNLYGNPGIDPAHLFIRAVDTSGNFSQTETRVIDTMDC
jgi:hypothetical protein